MKDFFNNEYSYFKEGTARDSFFGKGTIDKIAKSTTINATQFAIEVFGALIYLILLALNQFQFE